MTLVVLRPANPADSEWCFQLHKAAMGEYITTIWGWNEQRQRDSHTRSFNPGRWQIITAGGTDIGIMPVILVKLMWPRFVIGDGFIHGVGGVRRRGRRVSRTCGAGRAGGAGGGRGGGRGTGGSG
jgi:hypothetical protein